MSFTPFAADEVFSRQAMNQRLGQVDIPTGIICMWSGAANAIPTGWALCNGSNGTPDLRGRFVLGAGGTYAVGAKGGEETHKLTVAEMPSHDHCVPTYGGSGKETTVGTDATSRGIAQREVYSSYSGSSQPHNNMPPYYALCYIMKL